MGTYAFRILCVLSGGDFEIEDRDILLPLPAPAPSIHVKLGKLKDRAGDWTLVFRAGGFQSEQEAREAGAPVRAAVMLAGVLLGVGIDIGIDAVVGHPPHRALGRVPGLVVVPETGAKPSLNPWVGRPVRRLLPGDFEKAIAESYPFGSTLTKKQMLAAQLYNQSHFHSSDAARLITLTSAVEALAERAPKSGATVELLERMIKIAATAGDLEKQEREALNNGLRDLRRQSISSACKALVRMHCGTPAAKEFERAYRIRSTMLHDGEPPSGTDLMGESRKLDEIVGQLVVKHVAAGPPI